MNHGRISHFNQLGFTRLEWPTLNGSRSEKPNMTSTDQLLAGGYY